MSDVHLNLELEGKKHAKKQIQGHSLTCSEAVLQERRYTEMGIISAMVSSRRR